MNFWQEVGLATVSGCVGMLFSALLIVWKYGPRIEKLRYGAEHVERAIERIELAIAKINLAEFENRFLERLNGRYLKTDLAEALVKRSDERWDALKLRLEHAEKEIKHLHSHHEHHNNMDT